MPNSSDQVYSYKIENKNGMSITVIEYGATLISVQVPNGQNETEELIIGRKIFLGEWSNRSTKIYFAGPSRCFLPKFVNFYFHQIFSIFIL